MIDSMIIHSHCCHLGRDSRISWEQAGSSLRTMSVQSMREMRAKEVSQDAEAGLGHGCSEGFPGAIIPQKLLLPICSRFCPESSCTDNLGGLMISLIFDVSELCVKGFRLGDGERDPTATSCPGAQCEAGCQHLYTWT